MKQKKYWGILLLSGCLTFSMATLAWTEDGEGEGHERHERGFLHQAADIGPITNKAYKTECSACHFAYPAGFLPERSWVKIMNNLDDHFGENAELNDKTRLVITDYLRTHAADRLPNRFSRSMLRSVDAGATPLRISETSYFRHKHREIPARMVTGNPKVGSFSNCLSCHSGADNGSFDEHSVTIPGFRQWED